MTFSCDPIFLRAIVMIPSINYSRMNTMIFYLTLIFFLHACNPFVSDSMDGPALKKEMERIKQAIHEEISEARADDVSHCRALAFGAKPCGGPWTYLPYSVQVSDEEKLKELADKYFILNKKYNEVTGQMSDCAYVGEPQITLSKDGQCMFYRMTRD